MTNKVIITASAPTSYQYGSLQRFGMEITKHANGSFSASQEFDSIELAKAHLIRRADLNAQSPEALREMEQDIENNGVLTIDACTAVIEEVQA